MSTGVDPTSVAGKSPTVERRVPLVVIGAGPAGLSAAMAAAQAGVKVLLVDEHPLELELMAMDVPLYFGQRMSSAVRDRRAMLERVVSANASLADAVEAGVEVELGTGVWGAFRPGPTVRELARPMLGLADQSRSWLIGYERLIVAAGARDVAIGFCGWQKAGTMGAAAALALMARYQALAARRLVILGSGPLGLAVATLAVERGIAVPAVVEIAPQVRGESAVRDALERRGVRFYPGHCVKEARGSRDEVESVVLGAIDAEGRPIQGRETAIACDTICVAIGLVPNVELLHLLGCRLVFRSEHGGFVPEVDHWQCTSVPEVFAAGDCAGARESTIADSRAAAAQGRRAGLAAAASLGAIGLDRARALLDGSAPAEPDALLPAHDYWWAWLRASAAGDGADVLVCQCEEVTRGELLGVQPPRYLGWRSEPMAARSLGTLLRDGPLHPDQVKRLTRAGMGACQGRRCREQVALLLAEAGAVPVETIPTASYRPPVRPLPLSVLWPEDEPAEIRHDWVSWFAIPTQFAPHWVESRALPVKSIEPARPLCSPASEGEGNQPVTRAASVVIVGGGVTGLSAAWWLARSGVDVIVLDKGIVGWEASGRNGGGATHVYSPFGLEEQRLWPQMDSLLGYPTEYSSQRIKVPLSEDQLALYRRNAEIAAERGFHYERLDAKQLRELVPIAGDNALGGLYLHFGGHANPQRTIQAYAWAFQDLGGRIMQHTTVTGFRTVGGRVAAVETDRGTFEADVVVIAAGPHTGLLAWMLGVSVPLAPARVEMVCSEPLPLMRIGGVDGNGLYGRQTRRGNLVYGGGPHEWIEVAGSATPEQPTTPLLRNLSRRLAELFPGAAHLRLIRSWAGIVENTPDGLPVIDRLTSPPNVVIATMSSVGFGLSPASGRAISELVIDSRCRFADLTALRLDRFANLAPDWRAQLGWVPAVQLTSV